MLNIKNKVSVIIPIYNVEQYLEKCLDSVINQTYKNLEIICVNDCSPDNSLKILEEYSKKDGRIKILNRKQNGGLSAARNSGMDVATGEYIYFLDSDDWIDLDYIEKMVDAAITNNVEVVLNTNILSHEKGKNTTQFLPFNTQKNISECLLPAEKCVWNIIWNTWAHLWKKEFLENIHARFPQGYIIEDMYFQAITFIHLKEIYVTRTSSYHYLVRDNSITGELKTNTINHCYKLIKIFNKTVDYLEDNNLLENNTTRLFNIINIMGPLEEKKEFINTLKKYFLRIKKYVYKNKNLYNDVEISFYEDVLANNDSILNANYYQKYIFTKLRENIFNRC